MTTSPSPTELLAQDAFKIEQRLRLFGRPVGLLLTGAWNDDGSAELTFGILALEPHDMCRIIATMRFERDAGLAVVRAVDPDDARDDSGVIERHFGLPVPAILARMFQSLGGALARAADMREERALEDLPIRETPAPAWVH